MKGIDFKIEKGIEVPKNKQGKFSTLYFPFDKMEKGDSFLIPKGGNNKTKSRVYQWGLRLGYKSKSQIIGEDLRVWLVEKGIK